MVFLIKPGSSSVLSFFSYFNRGFVDVSCLSGVFKFFEWFWNYECCSFKMNYFYFSGDWDGFIDLMTLIGKVNGIGVHRFIQMLLD